MSRQVPTLEDVAREAGVSRATVSRVVNGVRNVDPAIQDLVRRAIERTGYAPNQAARQLVTRRTTTVALVVSGAGDGSEAGDGRGAAAGGSGVGAGSGAGDGRRAVGEAPVGEAGDGETAVAGPVGGSTAGRAVEGPRRDREQPGGDRPDPEQPVRDRANREQIAFATRVFADPFFGRVVGGVVGHLRPRSMHPVLMFAETPEARQEVVTYLRQGGADGALVVSTHPDDPLPALLAEARLPAVLFARPGRPVPLSHVDLAHREGGRLAAEHLLARGCRRIVTVAGPLAVTASQERLAGFRDTLARHGIAHVPVAEGGFTADSGITAMASLLAEHPDLDGVFTANDLMAQGAVQALREHGRRVPQDVAVVGFDDSSVAVTCRPRLTTVRQPVEDMAATMCALLDDHIRGRLSEPTSVIFDPELVVRDSA
ncbi:LacI family DNA-binding transcriptional regulator [Streptomyces calvus]|uniref:LacI family transcriptional regulator n=1 Tax=Streptomyces calvus TaxID=67282 RepID=A0A514JKR4_9ACTN|nr:LacI family DNA-binding transcriptional regulator [Streptomyces calvus]QDI67936.1 LacI family transcriptional regulator [Streptomyces calvus]